MNREPLVDVYPIFVFICAALAVIAFVVLQTVVNAGQQSQLEMDSGETFTLAPDHWVSFNQSVVVEGSRSICDLESSANCFTTANSNQLILESNHRLENTTAEPVTFALTTSDLVQAQVTQAFFSGRSLREVFFSYGLVMNWCLLVGMFAAFTVSKIEGIMDPLNHQLSMQVLMNWFGSYTLVAAICWVLVVLITIVSMLGMVEPPLPISLLVLLICVTVWLVLGFLGMCMTALIWSFANVYIMVENLTFNRAISV